MKGCFVPVTKIKHNKKTVTGYRLTMKNGNVVEVGPEKKQCILNDLKQGFIQKVRYLYD